MTAARVVVVFVEEKEEGIHELTCERERGVGTPRRSIGQRLGPTRWQRGRSGRGREARWSLEKECD